MCREKISKLHQTQIMQYLGELNTVADALVYFMQEMEEDEVFLEFPLVNMLNLLKTEVCSSGLSRDYRSNILRMNND